MRNGKPPSVEPREKKKRCPLAYAILLDLRGIVASRQIEVADVELVEHLGRLGGVDGDDVFGGILAGVDEDGNGSAGMQVEVLGAIVHLALHHDPYILLAIVLAHLRHGYELGLLDLRGGGQRGGGGDCGHLGGRCLSLLEEPAEAGGIRLLG